MIYIFDVDGTLVHETGGDQCIRLFQKKYIHKKTINQIKQLQVNNTVYLCTGRRLSNFLPLMKMIECDNNIMENGAVIIKDGKVDINWFTQNKIQITNHFNVEFKLICNMLEAKGFKIDYLGRYNSFWVSIDSTSNKGSLYNMQALLYAKSSLSFFISGPKVLIQPEKMNKSNAIKYLTREKYIYIGDNSNDYQAMYNCFVPFTIDSADNEIKKLVKLKNGYVSSFGGHKGIIDILEKLLYNADNYF